MIMAIHAGACITIQASGAFSQNRKGSSTHSVIRSRNADEHPPREELTGCMNLADFYIVSPAGCRSK